jgi:6-phosphofructokinase 1
MNLLCVVSGGDAPGINAALLNLSTLAAVNGDTLLGAMNGFLGLMERSIIALSPDIFAWAGIAGSILPSSREPVLAKPEAQDKIHLILQQNRVDYVVLFGGDGTLRHIPPLLRDWNIPYIGIPTTIDNDVPGTELSLGFDSACNFAYHSIDGIRATAHALPGRLFMVETLGGSNGNLALAVANGAQAHAVVVPEYAYLEAWLGERLRWAVEHFGYGLLVIGEFAAGARTLVEELPRQTGIRMRDVRLGHAQRGAAPTHRDRVLAVEMTHAAYGAMRAGRSGIVVVQRSQVYVHDGALPDAPVLPDRAVYDRINGLVS